MKFNRNNTLFLLINDTRVILQTDAILFLLNAIYSILKSP